MTHSYNTRWTKDTNQEHCTFSKLQDNILSSNSSLKDEIFNLKDIVIKTDNKIVGQC